MGILSRTYHRFYSTTCECILSLYLYWPQSGSFCCRSILARLMISSFGVCSFEPSSFFFFLLKYKNKTKNIILCIVVRLYQIMKRLRRTLQLHTRGKVVAFCEYCTLPLFTNNIAYRRSQLGAIISTRMNEGKMIWSKHLIHWKERKHTNINQVQQAPAALL